MFRYLSLLLIFISNNVLAAAPTEGFADIVEPLMPAVVNINTVKYVKKKNSRQLGPENFHMDQFNELFEQFGLPFFMDEMPSNPKATSLGSGFIIDAEGYIVTNHHVIKDADEITVRLNDNKEFTAVLVGSDPKTDIAVLKINSNTVLPFVRFGNSSAARVGDWIITIGNPFGLGGTVTTGIISSKSRDIDTGGLIDDYIQTDAAINGGNSGGPMFNLHGEVIGVNTAIYAPSGTNIGIGFAIPSNSVTKVVQQLKTTGKIERGKLGIKVQELSSEIADGLGIKNVEGALIAEVEPSSSGAKAGLKAGDVIIEFNKHPVKNVRKLLILVAETPLNTEAEIKILRKAKEVNLKARISENKEAGLESNKSFNNDNRDQKGYIINGVKFADINDQLSKNLNITEQAGVVVVSNNAKDSWKTLLRGDIISALNQVPINNLVDLKEQFEAAKKAGKKNIVFLLKRNGMTIFLALPLA